MVMDTTENQSSGPPGDDGGTLCSYCHFNEADTIDHVIPRSRGGSNRPDNRVPACNACNASKGNRTPDEWLASLLRRLAEYNAACPRCCENTAVAPVGDHHRRVVMTMGDHRG